MRGAIPPLVTTRAGQIACLGKGSSKKEKRGKFQWPCSKGLVTSIGKGRSPALNDYGHGSARQIGLLQLQCTLLTALGPLRRLLPPPGQRARISNIWRASTIDSFLRRATITVFHRPQPLLRLLFVCRTAPSLTSASSSSKPHEGLWRALDVAV